MMIHQIRKNTTFWLFLIGLLVVTACTTETNTKNNEDIEALLQGRWELVEGIRNGKKAPTLEGTYFEFAPNQSLRTNMIGTDQSVNYTRADDLISVMLGSAKVEYLIERISTDSLQLSTTIQNFKFDLSLVKRL